MLADRLLHYIEYIHERGMIIRDIKPSNLAMGEGTKSNMLFIFDFGLAKMYRNLITKEHIPYREDRDNPGSLRYGTYNIHLNREQGRRDDLEALGNVLLYLYHGKLPWQGIYAKSVKDKIRRMGEMKSGKAMDNFLASSPEVFGLYFGHVRRLEFEERPDYQYLREVFRLKMDDEGWCYDDKFDWFGGEECGTLLPEEYRFDLTPPYDETYANL